MDKIVYFGSQLHFRCSCLDQLKTYFPFTFFLSLACLFTSFVSSQLVQLTEKYQPSLFDAWYKLSYFTDTSNMTTERISFPLVAEHFIILWLEV